MNSEIIGKLTDKEQLLGTCFLIGQQYVITAYHVIKDKTDIQIEFELIKQTRKVNNIYFFDENNVDFAILELNKEIEDDIEYMSIGSITSIEQGDFWETSGYPFYTIDVDEEQNNAYQYQYANGNINRIIKREIPDLELAINKQRDVTDWQGISGAPLIVNKQISGVIVIQRLSPQVKGVLKAISMEKIIDFLHDKTEILKVLSYRSKNLLNERINVFTQECDDKFFSFEYNGESFNSKCLILRPQYTVDDLAETIDSFLKDYASSLQEIIDAQNSDMGIKRKKERKIELAANKIKKLLIENNKICLALLWVILEGSFQAPRIASTYSLGNEDIKQDIYLFRDENNIKMSIGYAEMQKDILNSISKILAEIDKEVRSEKQESKILIWDELAINYLDIGSRLQVQNLVQKEQCGTRIELEIIILHSYDSSIYEKELYRRSNESNKLAERVCKTELDYYNSKIAAICSKYEWIKLKRINWISLPCSSLELLNDIIQN